MESVNGQVRPMPGYGNRNGLPRFKPYVYRGTGEDIMPWAITEDATVASLDDVGLAPQRLRRSTERDRCRACGNDYRSRRHRERCRCPQCGYLQGSTNHRLLCR